MTRLKKMMLAGAAAVLALIPAVAPASAQEALRLRPVEDEVIYFVLPDRFENGSTENDEGGLTGDRLTTGFDPTHKGFYHGGDLQGLIQRLDYIQSLGATAIWLGPIYRNRPVQGPPGQESAGYHGYWITDFLDVDPHFGTQEDLRAFVDAAHARGMRVYLDIITNHTADVITYPECPSGCNYRSVADYPYSRSVDGEPINDGFLGDQVRTAENFARLTDPSWAYTPTIPAGMEDVKNPAWLNDPIYYHNRGNSAWWGESTTYGDFAGLDDLMTENPRVVDGFIDIFGWWIDEFGIDGFRIDTAKHVNPEFWQAFVPAMQARAAARGIPNFYVFGEVYDLEAAGLARQTRIAGLPYVLDFAFQETTADVIARGEATERLARLFDMDVLYEGGAEQAMRMPTFLGNHDMGRFARFVREGRPEASEDEVLNRVILAHALMMFARGVPVIYYGDEQGFVGDGNDQDAREDMFPSRVASYNDNRLVGSDATTAEANFGTEGPLFEALAAMARIRAADARLRSGRMIVRDYVQGPGVFAFSRVDEDGGETLVVLNTSSEALRRNVRVNESSLAWTSVHGQCPAQASAPGSVAVELAPLSYVVCATPVGG
ncbi:alpha-amylase family glycosyl hydrolase [Brevundimonas sp.]|uniref:alpha-amylase family glycosyl hydrolase n=1 Tax=Brevundimonas sp. TaxID=1871086 RepID=UPI0025FABDC0|nr:alpha-amylase family glycosyl hydrolase [Brevundimonas sp.]